ncbi:MAG: hypothetical protein JW751_11795, partial [Polyangiaceae bacterium]|nr:hypothetical protein [Polyangiaceae bacterium]
APPPRREDALDVTVTFPTGFRYYSRNLLLTRGGWSPAEHAAAGASLGALGVSHRLTARGATARSHQLRGRIAPEAQAKAFLAAAERDLSAGLYTARIPPTRSLRIALHVARGATGVSRSLEVCVSHGLSVDRATTAEEVLAIERFATRHFAFEPAIRAWRVASRRWAQTPNAAPGLPRTPGGTPPRVGAG